MMMFDRWWHAALFAIFGAAMLAATIGLMAAAPLMAGSMSWCLMVFGAMAYMGLYDIYLFWKTR